MNDERAVVYLGLGSNLGDRRRNLAEALRRLPPLVQVLAVSSLYETQPVGPQEQPLFYNAACRGVTGLPPLELLRHVKQIEHDLGRRPDGGPGRRPPVRASERWGPRPIDIDVLLYGDSVIDEANLRVPHVELANRAFVLVPLAELAADLRHAELGRTIGEIADAIDRSGVQKRAASGWEQGEAEELSG